MGYEFDFGNNNVKTFKFSTKIIKKMEKAGGKTIYGDHYLGRIGLKDISLSIGLRTVLSWVVYWGLQWSKEEAMKEDEIDDMLDEYLTSTLDDGTRAGILSDKLMIPLLAGYGIDAEMIKKMEEEKKRKAEDGEPEEETPEDPN